MVCPGKGEPGAPRLEGENKDLGGLRGVLKDLHHLIPFFSGNASVKQKDLLGEILPKPFLEHLPHLPVLGEDEAVFPRFLKLLEKIHQAPELSGSVFQSCLFLGAFSRFLEGFFEKTLVPQKPRVEKVHEAPEIHGAILHGGSREGDAMFRFNASRRPGLLGLGIFDVLGLVEDYRTPGDLLKEGKIPLEEAEGGDHQSLTSGGGGKALFAVSRGSVVSQHRKLRGETLRLLAPIVHHRDGADEKSRAAFPLFSFSLKMRQGLDGLSQPHIVRQTGSEFPPAQGGEPGETLLLIVPQGSLKMPGNLLWLGNFFLAKILQRKKQARILLGLQKVVHLPGLILPGGFLQAQAEAAGGFAMKPGGAAPGGESSGKLPKLLLLFPDHLGGRRAKGLQPGIVEAGEIFRG